MMSRLYSSEGFPFPARAPAALDLLLADPSHGRCFLIRDAGSTIGYFVIGFGFSLEFGGRDAFLDELFIAPESRGAGIGKTALQHAIEFCRSEGIGALHLEVSRENIPAQRLYRGAGFRERHAGYDLLTLHVK